MNVLTSQLTGLRASVCTQCLKEESGQERKECLVYTMETRVDQSMETWVLTEFSAWLYDVAQCHLNSPVLSAPLIK